MATEIITIIGAHGTGKTVLAEFLLNGLDPEKYGFAGVHLVPDVARSCPYPIGARSNSQAQDWIFQRQAEAEAEARDLVILDNCLLGQYAYFQHWVGNDDGKLMTARTMFSNYGVIFYLPSDPALLRDDSVRPLSATFQCSIDARMRELISEASRGVFLFPKVGEHDRNSSALREVTMYLDGKYVVQVPVVLAFVICGDSILLTERIDPHVPSAHHQWDVIAGRVEFGEMPLHAVRRECLEEVGLRLETVEEIPISSGHVWNTTDGRFQSILLPFLCRLSRPCPQLARCVDEIGELRWVRVEDLGNYDLLPSLAPYLDYIRTKAR
jgi:8-oxo-dGTP pyrophosphatase MutT (NUDIX family)